MGAQTQEIGDLLKSRLASASLALVLTLVISQVALGQNQPSPTPPTMDRAAAEMYDLPFCSSSDQLDCVASVEVKPPSGDFVSVTTDRQQVWTLDVDSLGNKNSYGSIYWILPGDSGAREYFAVSAQLFTPAHTRVTGVLSVSVDGLPLGYMARVSVRTSWLRPQNLQFSAASASYSHSVIPGGNLWTFSGTHTKVSNYTSEAGYASNWNDQADVDEELFQFRIHHAGVDPERATWDPRCADSGFTAQAANAPSGGTPYWDTTTQSLQFNIAAPHLDSQGNKNMGFFRLWVSEAFASCEWPENKLVGADSLEARIFNEDGSIQDADITVTNENGMIYLDAKNFHYSAPIFQISAKGTPVIAPTAASALQPVPTSVNKKSSNPTHSNQPTPSSDLEYSNKHGQPRANGETNMESQGETEGAGIALSAGVFFLLVAGLGLTAYLRKKQGQPLFPLALKRKVSKNPQIKESQTKPSKTKTTR